MKKLTALFGCTVCSLCMIQDVSAERLFGMQNYSATIECWFEPVSHVVTKNRGEAISAFDKEHLDDATRVWKYQFKVINDKAVKEAYQIFDGKHKLPVEANMVKKDPSSPACISFKRPKYIERDAGNFFTMVSMQAGFSEENMAVLQMVWFDNDKSFATTTQGMCKYTSLTKE